LHNVRKTFITSAGSFNAQRKERAMGQLKQVGICNALSYE